MISIVVPCYNCETTLERCVNSLLNQTESNIEIILVDDGSTDKTFECCETFAKKDLRIKFIHQKNGGLMNAWKRGTIEATGEYIMFCDADDYLDLDSVAILYGRLRDIHVDIIVYGMKMEYEDGSVVYQNNRLEKEFYTREEITDYILPLFFSDGNMESCIIQMSRCTKIFRRELLVGNLKYLNDKISVGEDALTTFATVLSAEALCFIKEYYPYHYVRNNSSMIGKYDPSLFRKIIDLRKEMFKIADAYQYAYPLQIEAYFLSKTFLCMKKEICRNKNVGYRAVRKQLKDMRENEIMVKAIGQCSIRRYDLKSKLFACMMIKKQYLFVYYLTRVAEKAGLGQA